MFKTTRSNSKSRNSGGFTQISTLHVLALSGATAVGTGGVLVSSNQELAMTNAVELVQLAHSQARTTALRSGQMVRLDVDAASGRIVVTLMSGDARSSEVQLREVAPPAVAIESDFETICFDGHGDPVVGGECEVQTGSITIRTLTEETSLTLNGEGRLDR